MGQMIRLARIQQKQTTQTLAERAGISRSMLQRIEKGDPKCEMGVVFELATLLGIQLFDSNEQGLHQKLRQTGETLTLLPKQVRSTRSVDDEF